jgi:tRNA threonylcarbamoyladenosine biosynthesis protein TsaE
VNERVISTDSAEATARLGRRLAALLAAGDTLLLHGDLGAGKTTLAQGILAALRPGTPATSPTFTLINEYAAGNADQPPVHHLDLYRLDGPDDLDSIGFDDLVGAGTGILLVEWPERLGDDLPDDYLLVSIEAEGADQRRVTVRAMPGDGRHARIVSALD